MTFVETFFGPGNRLRWEAIQSGALSQDVQDRLGPLLDELRLDADVLTLPRVLDSGQVQWYVLCSSARAARIARDELRAFLGPSYSNFDGRPAVLDPNDSIDAAVLARYGYNVFRVDVPQRHLLDLARERLRLMVSLRKERPVRTGGPPRPVGRLLRDFEYALLTGSDDEARALLGQLRSEGHLSATNILFLEVRRLAASRHWDAIMAMPELDALVSMPRPKRVTEAVLQAVYETRLREYQASGRADDAVARFRIEVYPGFNIYIGHVQRSGEQPRTPVLSWRPVLRIRLGLTWRRRCSRPIRLTPRTASTWRPWHSSFPAVRRSLRISLRWPNRRLPKPRSTRRSLWLCRCHRRLTEQRCCSVVLETSERLKQRESL